MCLLRDELSDQRIGSEIRRWKQDYKRNRGDTKAGKAFDPDSEVFWVSADFRDAEDAISRYRFRECFEVGGFDTTFDEVERAFAASLVDGLDENEIISSGKRHVGSPHFPVVFSLWLISRSSILRNRIRAFVDIGLTRVASWQSLEGWWSRPGAGVESSPSTYVTALCSLVLTKLASSTRLRENATLGLKWLLRQQEPDGYWSDTRGRKGGSNLEPDLITTLWALEGLIRGGVPNATRSTDLGTSWLLSQQREFGDWNSAGFDYVWVTTLVLEYLQLHASKPQQVDPYMHLAKGLIDRGIQLSYEETTESARLAIVAAYHGLEAFLYSILGLPKINKQIFRLGAKGETIGFRAALDEFQRHLQAQGVLPSGSPVRNRNELDRMAHFRDEIVHKALDVTAAEARTLTDAALRFATYYCSVLGYNPWF